MRLLYYNWVPINSSLGGGVHIYQKALLEYFNLHPEDEVYYLSSGQCYSVPITATRITEENNEYNDNIRTFIIVNSPVFSPMSLDPKNIEMFLNDETLSVLFEEFIDSIGGVDVIHFNNIEGLTLRCLEIKKRYPNTRVIYSAHNYCPICPNVMLWKRDGLSEYNCDEKTCDICAKYYNTESYDYVIKKRVNNNVAKKVLSRLERILPRKFDKHLFELFREENKRVMNNYVDCILAVSDRVKDIFVKEGFNPQKIRTMYIGTRVASHQLGRCCSEYSQDRDLHIAYLGYMTESKGFYFFLDALEEIDDEIASHICVKICAKYDKKKKGELKRIERLNQKYKAVVLYNGFTHDNEKELLSDVNLGIVPVLWEDNLPQVLIEQISYGVPVLVSTLGGGKEIVNDDDFVFKAGDTNDFKEKLISIYYNPSKLSDFWDNSKKLVTCEYHLKELIAEYEQH